MKVSKIQTKNTKITSKTAPGKIQSPKKTQKTPSSTVKKPVKTDEKQTQKQLNNPQKSTQKPQNSIQKSSKTQKEESKKQQYATKEKGEDIDRRAFVSGQAPTKIEAAPVEKKTAFSCIKTVKVYDDVENVILINNSTLVTCCHNGTIKLFDTAKDVDKPLLTLAGHTEAVKEVIQMGNNTIITVSIDTTIRKFSTTTGKELTCYKAKQPVYCIKKIDDAFIAIGGADKKVKILDFPQNRLGEDLKEEENIESFVFEGHVEGITCLELDTNGRLISGSMDKTIKIWDLDKKKIIDTLFGHTDCVRCLKCLKDAPLLASGSDDNSILIWDLNSFKPTKTLKGHTGHVMALDQLQDGRLVSGGSDWNIIVWNLETEKEEIVLEGHEESVYSVVALPDGRIVSGAADQTMKIWE